MWKQHDNYMRQLKQLYNKTSKQTQNRLQELFDTFDFTSENIYNIADNKTKKRINTYIEQWKEQGLLKNNNYFSVLANNIYKRTRVKNSEILELLIYSAYIEEQSKLEEKEKQIMYEDTNYYYEEGQKEVNKKKKPSILEMALFLALLDQPNYSGFNWEQYVEATMQYNAQQIYKQVILNIQQKKDLEIDSSEFQTIINRQNNQKLNINDDKISGAADMQMIGLNNLAKVEGIKKIAEDNSKVRFIAVEDDKTTLMCDSLNNQEFYINKENVFDRYYGETQKELKIQRIRCNGLVLGLNLPPIQHHFHYCRSTIMYLPPVEKQEKTSYNDIEYPSYIRLNVNKDYKPESEIDRIVNAITKLPYNIRNLIEDTNYEIFSEGKVYRNNHIIKNSFYDRKEDKIYIMDGENLTEGEVIHEIGHAIETKLNILNDKKYIKIRNAGLENYNQELIKYNEELGMNGIKNAKFISDLQGKIYNKDLQGNLRTYSNGNINMNCLGDYFSEGFREYIENKENLLNKDKSLFEYIRGVINEL
jgi:hypothetical protein